MNGIVCIVSCCTVFLKQGIDSVTVKWVLKKFCQNVTYLCGFMVSEKKDWV
jgi:hypothetical protein